MVAFASYGPIRRGGCGVSGSDIFARCIDIAIAVRDGFLSEEYAVGQPLSSHQERFACNQVIEAIYAEQKREAAMTELARLGQEIEAFTPTAHARDLTGEEGDTMADVNTWLAGEEAIAGCRGTA